MCLTACGKKDISARQDDLVYPPILPMENLLEISEIEPAYLPFSENNSIDRAFAKMFDEREGLQDNTTLAYLYALLWQKEYDLLLNKLLPDERAVSSRRYYAKRTAIEYAERVSKTSKAIERFEGIARYYKLMVIDNINLLEQSEVIWDILTDEDELYDFLKDFHSYIPISYYDYIAEHGFNGYRKIVPMLIVAELAVEDVQILSAQPFGSVLRVRGEDFLYHFQSGVDTPREILPWLSLYDYDSDNIDEIAVISTEGTGTEYYVEELNIININEGNEYGFSTTTVTAERVASLLYHRLSGSYDEAGRELTIKLDEQELIILIPTVDWDSGNGRFTGFNLTDIIRFDVNDGILSTEVRVGYYIYRKVAIPSGYFTIKADIILDETIAYGVSLDNCRLEP